MANTAPKKETTKKDKAQEKVQIVVPKPTNVVGDTETVVSVNGEMYQIMYDRPIIVPKNVAEVIENSRRLRDEIDAITQEALLVPGKNPLADL